jgi:hypothetical protein
MRSAIILILFFGTLNAQTRTGSFPWVIDVTEPKAVAEEVLQAFIKEDYFSVYGLINEKIMNEVNLAVARMDTTKFGVDVDFSFMMTSDFGRRYGVQALFDQIMAKSQGKYFSWAARLHDDDLVFDKIHAVDEEQKSVQFSSRKDGSLLSIYLEKNGSNWFFEKVKFRNEEWPPFLKR